MMTGRKHQEEMRHLAKDHVWWLERLPKGWKLYGFTYRERATAWDDKGRLVENIPGAVVDALYKERHFSP